MNGHLINDHVAEQLREMYRKLQHLQAGIDFGSQTTRHVTSVRWFRLTEDLSAPTDFNSPGIAEGQPQLRAADGTFTDDLTQPVQDIVLHTGGELTTDNYLLCWMVAGEWIPVAGDNVGSGGGGGGGCCCCISYDFWDVVLSDDIETLRAWVLCSQLNQIVSNQEHGVLTITFPAPDQMVLSKETAPSDRFVWEFDGTEFSAIYWDETDATGDLSSPSGSVIFEHDDGNDEMVLTIEWDAEIPEQVAS